MQYLSKNITHTYTPEGGPFSSPFIHTLIFTIAVCILCTTAPHATQDTETETPITIYVQEMGTKYDITIHSFFRDLWAAYSEGAPSHIFRVVPILRKEHMLKEDRSSCMYPANARPTPFIQNGVIMLQSRIYGKLNLRAYSRPQRPLIRTWANMAGKSIVVPRAWILTENIPGDDYSLIEVPTSETRVVMLIRGRTDIMIGTSPFADLILRSKGETRQLYDPTFIMGEQPLTLICYPSKKNQLLIDAINRNYLSKGEDGTLEAIFTKYNLSYSEFHVDPNRKTPFFNYKFDEGHRNINRMPNALKTTLKLTQKNWILKQESIKKFLLEYNSRTKLSLK